MLRIRFFKGFSQPSKWRDKIRVVERWHTGCKWDFYSACFWDVNTSVEIREMNKKMRKIVVKAPEIWVTIQDDWWETLRGLTHELGHYLIWKLYRRFGYSFVTKHIHKPYEKIYAAVHKPLYRWLVNPLTGGIKMNKEVKR